LPFGPKSREAAARGLDDGLDGAGVLVHDSIVDPAGTRLGVKSGSALNWLLPDLHGNVAAQLDPSTFAITYATRYDPWGEIIDTGPGTNAGTAGRTWTYQGRLDVSPAGINQPLLDGGARLYSPALGTFTSLDSVTGSAQDPLSMNRYLYAEANPATFIDPTGHCIRWIRNRCVRAPASVYVSSPAGGSVYPLIRARGPLSGIALSPSQPEATSATSAPEPSCSAWMDRVRVASSLHRSIPVGSRAAARSADSPARPGTAGVS